MKISKYIITYVFKMLNFDQYGEKNWQRFQGKMLWRKFIYVFTCSTAFPSACQIDRSVLSAPLPNFDVAIDCSGLPQNSKGYRSRTSGLVWPSLRTCSVGSPERTAKHTGEPGLWVRDS
jgi:hypothetical protein